jgi:hypothetical protein
VIKTRGENAKTDPIVTYTRVKSEKMMSAITARRIANGPIPRKATTTEVWYVRR